MFKQNPILNLFSDDCDIGSFKFKNRQLNKIQRLESIKKSDQGYDNRLKRMIIDCGNKCCIRNSRVIRNEITFMQIRNCSIMCKKENKNEQQDMNKRTKNSSVKPIRMEEQYQLEGWTKESWKSL